jgi:PKD repeat protein
MRSIILFLFLLCMPGLAFSQCPGCIPDTGCTVSPPFPALCPAQPPAATAGEAYEADLTFWMPANFNDPGSGIAVDFEQMTVTGITGLPFGLSIEMSSPAGVYFPQQNQFGCARICGTPITAGTYNVTISILATVSVSGFTTQVPEQFIMLLNVQPGSGGNTSFTYNPASGCGSVTASFNALIDGGSSPTTYAWDFGNGSTGNIAQPPAQTYDEPGEYVITLETSIGGYVLNTVIVTGVNDNWCGDIEEPNLPFVGCSGAPDLYFVLTDGNGATFTSSTQDDTFSASWTGVGQVLSNPPYSLSIYDEDWISPDDHLGTYNIPLDGAGTYYFNVAGGTTGSIEVSLQTQQVFTDSDTLVVHPMPEVEILNMGGQLCANDPSMVSYLWVLDGDTLPGLTNACIAAPQPGIYTLVAVGENGCSGTSEPLVVCPQLQIEATDNVLHVPSGYISYQWTLNGSPVGTGQPFLVIQESGTYAVVVDAGDDCIVTATLELLVGIGEHGSQETGMRIYPNPNDGLFTVELSGMMNGTVRIDIHDVSGKLVHTSNHAAQNGTTRAALMLNAQPGMYHLKAWDGERQVTGRVVIK